MGMKSRDTKYNRESGKSQAKSGHTDKPVRDAQKGGGLVFKTSNRAGEELTIVQTYSGEMVVERKTQGAVSSEEEESRIISAIDQTLDRIELVRAESRAGDEEVARLGAETRNLIAELQRELNLKAA